MRSIFLVTLLVAIFSCEPKEESSEKSVDWSKEKSTDLAKDIVFEEQIDIQLYLKRRPDWKMIPTGTGLQYWIYEDQEGETAKEGDIVEVAFEVRLLDDSLCYKTEASEVATFKVDKSDVESGVQEGIKYLSKGDKAKLIIPSHLGHGLVGDLNRIPPLQALVVDVEVVDIK